MFCSCLKAQPKTEDEETVLPALLTTDGACQQNDAKKLSVDEIQRQKTITLKYSVEDGPQMQEDFDFLIVACNPNHVNMSLTADENKVFSQENTKSSIIQTTLFRFAVNVTEESKLWPAICFAPAVNSRLDGSVYGYRSETRKTLNAQPCDADHELVTVYQVVEPDFVGKDPKEFSKEALKAILMKDLPNTDWFPYDVSQGKIVKTYRTPYFQRFQHKAIADNVADPWNILSLQGENNTIFVHASSCFESVLHVYQYFSLVHDHKPDVFPVNKGTSRIAILGAGPSGLIAARLMRNLGYGNIRVFEALADTALVAGKTQTWIEQAVPGQDTVCELGTCYMSPAYDEMIKDLQDPAKGGNLFDGNKRINLDSPPSTKTGAARFRQIVTAGQFSSTGAVMKLFEAEGTFWTKQPLKSGTFPATLEFPTYYRLKSFEETELTASGKHVAALKLAWDASILSIAKAGLEYCYYHVCNFHVFGRQWPMPTTRLSQTLLNQTIYEFLDKNNLKALIGLFQYAYSVQGYGSVNKDTTEDAVYLLIWVPPAAFFGMLDPETKTAMLSLFDELADETDAVWKYVGSVLRASQGESTVTAWSEGWGKAWENQKKLFLEDPAGAVKIEYTTKIAGVQRDIKTGKEKKEIKAPKEKKKTTDKKDEK